MSTCTTGRGSSLLRPRRGQWRPTRTSRTAWTTRWTAWSTDFRSAFAPAGERQQTIISVLPDDTVGYVLDRLDDAGRVAVLVLLADGLLRITPLAPAPEARIVVAAEDDQVLPIHQDSRADLFLDYLERVRPWFSGWRGWWIAAPAH